MPIKEALLSEYDHEMATTRKLLERVPDEKLSWTPHHKSRSLGGLATHLANLALWAQYILDRSSFDLDDVPPTEAEETSREAVLGVFDRARGRARTFLDRSDAEYLAPWTLNRGGQQMFTLPRVAAFRTFVLSHVIHHRGQLSVYLRLNDVAVPSIYGPSADEG
jgi:uncharacterized damage-inducible protein DinB